jgi:RNA polymerase sigma-70 factor (ECF subfamily)
MKQSVFEEVLNDNKDKIFRICRIYASAPIEPEDLFQEVTIHLWKAFPSFEQKSAVNTWVYRIALNVCMRYKSKLQNHNEKTIRLESVQFDPPASTPDTIQEEKYKALRSCMQELDEIDQSIVILTLDELSYKEISKITGLTENHVAVKMKRTRKALLHCINHRLK